MSSFDLYAEYAAAAYCNTEDDVGTTVTCIDDVCSNVTAAGAVVTATFALVLPINIQLALESQLIPV